MIKEYAKFENVNVLVYQLTVCYQCIITHGETGVMTEVHRPKQWMKNCERHHYIRSDEINKWGIDWKTKGMSIFVMNTVNPI